ncbi:MAG: IS200/IS605 family transposase [Chryseobacterium sp.]|nr:MAG: IS200/IS605 family transposase [Chryseobacterium sp.]
MGQSLVQNYIHIIFSTKHRENLIDESIQEELFSYLGGICKNLECQPLQVGGYLNHVHILCMLSKKVSLSKLIEEVKSHSSKWIKTKGLVYSSFYWQNGYGAFSVNPNQINVVVEYIQQQKQHHLKMPFEMEFRKILNKYDADYDERYVWD